MSPRSSLVTPDQVRTRAERTYARHVAGWAAEVAGGRPGPEAVTTLEVPLHPPSQDDALGAVDATISWVRAWHESTETGHVVWETRRWAHLGRQDVPVRAVLTSPDEIARAARRVRHWELLRGRTAGLAERWGRSEALGAAVRRCAGALADLDDADLATLVAVVDWVVQHPDLTVYVRQLPVPGIHGKWVERHRALLTALVAARTGRQALGFASPPSQVRVCVLDPRLRPGGLRDLTAPVVELAAWDVEVNRVLVVENLQSVLPLPDAHGTIAVHGAGFAVDLVGRLPWVQGASVDYWGDLDSHGFAILDRMRAHVPHARSLLMDTTTLLAHRELWTADPNPSTAALSRLTEPELVTRAELSAQGDVRLEQERLNWTACLAALGLG